MKIRVAPKRSCRVRERDRKMGSPRPNYGRVKGMCEYQGLAGGGRWGAFLGGQTNYNSYTYSQSDRHRCTPQLVYTHIRIYHVARSSQTLGTSCEVWDYPIRTNSYLTLLRTR